MLVADKRSLEDIDTDLKNVIALLGNFQKNTALDKSRIWCRIDELLEERFEVQNENV